MSRIDSRRRLSLERDKSRSPINTRCRTSRWCRPYLELLEDRTLLSPLPLDNAIKGFVETGASVVQSAITAVDSNLFSNILGTSLPLVGNALASVGGTVNDLFKPIGTTLSNALGSLSGTIMDTDVINALTTALGAKLNGVITDTVTPNAGNTAIQQVEFFLDIKGTLIDSSFSPNFNLGLPALNLQVNGKVNVTLSYEFKLGLGINDTGIYIDTDSANTSLSLTLDVSTPGLTAQGTLFFLQLNATDGTPPAGMPSSPPSQFTKFDATFAVTIAPVANNQLYLATDLSDLADLNATLSGEADVHLAMVLSFGGSASFPSLHADFDMTWMFAAGTSVDTSNNAADFGSDPNITFNNIGLDLGSFFSQFVTPIVKEIKSVLAPFQPVINILNTRMPVLSDIGFLRNFFGGANPVTLLDVINTLEPSAALSFLTTVVNLDNFVNSIPTDVPGDTVIPLGSFNLNANGLDARSATDLSTASLTDTTGMDALSELNALNIPDVTNFVSQVSGTSMFGGGGGDGGTGLQFPLIQNPTSVFGLLLGQNVNLFTFTMPTLNVSVQFDQFFSILGPLGVELKGTVNQSGGPGGAPLDASAPDNTALELLGNVTFGYDTAGIVEFANDGFAPAKIGDLLDGFFVSTAGPGQRDATDLLLNMGFGAFAALDLVVFDAGVGGGINANVNLTLSPQPDNKLRFSEIGTLLSQGPQCLFNASGDVTAGLSAYVKVGFDTPFGFVGYQHTFNIAQATLLTFNYACAMTQNPPDPNLATKMGNVLRLNIGQYAGDRGSNADPTQNTDEVFKVDHVSGTAGNETVQVSAEGYQETYTGVAEIDAYCNTGDAVTIDPGVLANAKLNGGGSGMNHLMYEGSGTATLTAVGTMNQLSGGSGMNTLDARMAMGNDTLIGGTGPNLFYASLNVPNGGVGDTMIAGPGPDTMNGGNGPDYFVAGGGNDTMNGGTANDVFSWTVGDGSPTIVANPTYLNTLEVSGGAASDTFEVDPYMGTGVTVVADGVPVSATGIALLNIDGDQGMNQTTIDDLSGTTLQSVTVNAAELTTPDTTGPDTTTINGPPSNTTMLINEFTGTTTTGVGPMGMAPNAPGPTMQVTGLGPRFLVANAADHLIVNLGNGNDTSTIATSTLGGTLAVNGGTGTDVYNVQSTSGPTTIKTQGGQNTINVGAQTFFGSVVGGIQGALTVDGSGGSDAMYVSDSGDFTSTTGTLTSAKITGLGTAGIAYSGLSTVNVTLGFGAHNQFNIQNTAAGVSTSVDGFLGIDTFYVGSMANNAPTNGSILDTIQGALTIGGSLVGLDTLNADDTGSMGPKTGQLTRTAFTGMAMGAQGITYSGLGFLNIFMGTGGDTMNIQSTAAGTTTTIDPPTGSPNTFNVGSQAGVFPVTPGIVDNIQGPLVIVGSGADTMNVDDTGSTTAKTGTLTATTLTGLNMAGITYSGLVTLNISLGTGGSTGNSFNINVAAGQNLPLTTNINGGSGGKDTLMASWVKDFNNTLNLLDFAMTTVTVGNNFNGSMTDKNPAYIQSIMIGGSLTASGVLDVVSTSDPANPITPTGLIGDIGTMTVGGSIAGLVMVSGNITTLDVGPANTATAGDVNDVSGKVIVGGALTTASVSGNVSGTIMETLTINVLYIGGSLTQTGLISAVNAADNAPVPANPTLGNINTLTIVGNLAGTLIVSGTLGTFNLGGTFTNTGSITVGYLNSMTIQGDLAGQLTVLHTLKMLTVHGGTPGTVVAGQIGTIAVYAGYGPVVAQIKENGIQRRIEAAVPTAPFPTPPPPPAPTPAVSPTGITFPYFYEGLDSPSVGGLSSPTNLANPQLTIQVSNKTGSTAPDQFDLSLITYNDAAKFNLARLDATGNSGVSGIRNVAVEGDILTKVTAAASAFFAPDSSPAGIYLPQDNLAGVGVRDYVPIQIIKAKSIQAVAFGSMTRNNGQLETGAAANGNDAATLLAPGTAIVQAGSSNGTTVETFRVPFADLPAYQVGFFLDTDPHSGNFDSHNIALVVQALTTPNATLTANIVTPENVARGAVIALIKAAQTFDNHGKVQNSVVQTIAFRGDGASMVSEQYIAVGTTSTGPLGDLTFSAGPAINSVTAPSIFGSIGTNNPIVGTIQTTGQRTDPISGIITTVPADLGRLFITMTNKGPIEVNTTVTSKGPGLSGAVIVRGNLISQISSDGGISGLIAVQGNVAETNATDQNGHAVRLGGIVSNGGFSGQLVVLGTTYGDVLIHGGLTAGRMAFKRNVLGNVEIDGSIDAASALVAAGNIGDAVAGTALTLNGDVKGIVAAEGNILLAKKVNSNNAAFYGANLKTTDTASAAAIDAIFTNMGIPLAFDQTGLDLAGLGLILTDLASLHVANGKLTGTTP